MSEANIDVIVWARDSGSRSRLTRALDADGLSAQAVLELDDVTADARSSAGVAHVAVLLCRLEALRAPRELQQLRAALPDTPLIVVDDGPAKPAAKMGLAARKALRAGARGYIALDEVELALVAAVRAVAAGQLCAPLSVVESAPRPRFSLREIQVLELASAGLSNSEIGRALGRTESTVKSHLYTGFRKLGVRSRAEAAAVLAERR